jgi:hypothetical protein
MTVTTLVSAQQWVVALLVAVELYRFG